MMRLLKRVPLAAVLTAASLGAHAQVVPTFAVGPDVVVPTPVVSGGSAYYFNDSVFPYLPSEDGTTNILFWGDAWAHRYSGPDILHMQPSPGTLVTRTRIGGLPSDDTAYDSNGDWMNEAHRMSDGSLVAFVHAENHHFTTGSGQWNSTGLWISEDDGNSWTDYGQVAGDPKPAAGQFGGWNYDIGPIWDTVNSRWIAYCGNTPFVSRDPHGMPGTWYAKDTTADFTIPMNPTKKLTGYTTEPSLPSSMSGGSISWNTYLNEYVIVYQENGDSNNARIAFSADGLHWVGNVELTSEPTGGNISYMQLIGTTDQLGGQTMQLVYDRQPAVGNRYGKNNKDIVTRTLTFTLPTN